MPTNSGAPAVILCGSASRTLHAAVLGALDAPDTPTVTEVLPDGELRFCVGRSIRGADVYAIQSLGTPVGDRLIELALIIDAVRRAGARQVTAVVPYLGYSRHDRRGGEGEPLGGAVISSLLSACAIDRLVALDLHTPALEGFFRFPVDHLTAEPLLGETIRPLIGRDGVVVSPDLGAAKLARRHAQRLGLPLAVVHKTRLGPSKVAAEGVAGDVRGRRPVIVDDIISTGATMARAIEAVLQAGAVPDVIVAATHGVFAPGWRQAFAHPAVRRLLVTNSIELTDAPEDERIQCVSLHPLLADAIGRLHDNASLSGLLARG